MSHLAPWDIGGGEGGGGCSSLPIDGEWRRGRLGTIIKREGRGGGCYSYEVSGEKGESEGSSGGEEGEGRVGGCWWIERKDKEIGSDENQIKLGWLLFALIEFCGLIVCGFACVEGGRQRKCTSISTDFWVGIINHINIYRKCGALVQYQLYSIGGVFCVFVVHGSYVPLWPAWEPRSLVACMGIPFPCGLHGSPVPLWPAWEPRSLMACMRVPFPCGLHGSPVPLWHSW